MRRGLAIAGIVGLAATVVVLSRRPLTDYDLPWNLATGRILWASHAIPRIDDLAFTHGALRYVEVVGDWFLWGVRRYFGDRGLQTVGALSAAIAFGATFLRARRAHPIAMLLTSWLAAATVSWFTVRPATLSFALLSAGLLVIDGHRECVTRWTRLLPVVPLAFLWANVHGFVALFALLLAFHALDVVFEARRRPDVAGAARATALLVLAALGAASINTLGPALLLGSFRAAERFSGITEHARPSLRYLFYDVPVASALFAVAVLSIAVGKEPDGRRVPPLFDVLVSGVAIVGFFGVVRLTPVALLLLVPIAARRLSSLVPLTNLIGGAIAFTPLAAAAYAALFVETSNTPGFDAKRLPVDAADFVLRVAPAGRMYNFMPFGGYLAYRLHPRYRVFNDGRNALARSAEFVRRARVASSQPETFAQIVRDYSLEWAVTTSAEGESQDIALGRSPEWTMIYLDDVAAVYVRRSGPNAGLAAAGYRALRHHLNPSEVIEVAMSDGDLPLALWHDGALAFAQAPWSSRASFLAAAGGIAGRDPELFTRGVESLGRHSPGHPALSLLQQAWRVRLAERPATTIPPVRPLP